MSRQLAQALAEGLKSAGVTRMFGVPGGGPNLDMIGAAQQVGIDFVLAHGETSACIMAATHGYLTDSVGVALVTRGPGFASACNGLAQALLDRYPLLLVSDCVPAATAGHVMHQRVDQVRIASGLTKFSGVLGADRSIQTVQAALELARAKPMGPIHLTFDSTAKSDNVPTPQSASRSNPESWTRAASRVAAARRPLAIVGLDAVADTDDVRKILANVSFPIMTTYMAKGVIPQDWPQYAGLFTGVPADRPLLEQSDLIIGIGVDPVEPMPGRLPSEAPSILVHSHQVETEYFGDSSLLIGTYGTDLPNLLERASADWVAAAVAHRSRVTIAASRTAAELTPEQIVTTTQAIFSDSRATVDAGAHMLPTMALWQVHEPNQVLISNGLATMGFALPAAIGSAFAEPGRRTVCFVGDGGLGMCLAELEVLARCRLPITVVVFNDSTLSLIKHKQGLEQGDESAVSYAEMDFANIARNMGIPGMTAKNQTELAAALAEAGQGPMLVDARIDGSSYGQILKVLRG